MATTIALMPLPTNPKPGLAAHSCLMKRHGHINTSIIACLSARLISLLSGTRRRELHAGMYIADDHHLMLEEHSS
ncbi:MAG: hypothetical protein KGL90_09860 [Burkholderiales bacterium]|nr:hypothetical protein [Burkholderiales bacterium]